MELRDRICESYMNDKPFCMSILKCKDIIRIWGKISYCQSVTSQWLLFGDLFHCLSIVSNFSLYLHCRTKVSNVCDVRDLIEKNKFKGLKWICFFYQTRVKLKNNLMDQKRNLMKTKTMILSFVDRNCKYEFLLN
jgi:hypothetical protein